MRQLLRFLKYVPSVAAGVLIVAWVVSWFGSFGYFPNVCGPNNNCVTAWCGQSAIGCGKNSRFGLITDDYWHSYRRWRAPATFAGRWEAKRGYNYWSCEVPIPAILTAILPLSLGTVGFRYGLWQCLAYTALVSCELAYYLSWQSGGG